MTSPEAAMRARLEAERYVRELLTKERAGRISPADQMVLDALLRRTRRP
jgi:hypothetical protein